MTGGLRERKKAATRTALSAAALRLAAERGVDAVTVHDIAAAADVSPRTFFNHFASKEEAFVAEDLDRAHDLLDRFRAEPTGAPLWPTLVRLLGDHLESSAPRSRQEALAEHAVRTSPAVLAQQFKQYAGLESDLIAELALRSGHGVDDLPPRLMAAAAVGAMRAAVNTWLASTRDTAGPRPLFDAAAAQLASAFPLA